MFEKYIQKLKSYGWKLILEHENGYLFQKKDWYCDLDGPSNTISFFRWPGEIDFYEGLNRDYRPSTEQELHDYHESFDESNTPRR